MKRKLLFTLSTVLCSFFAYSQFTSGNLVVLRLGDGTAVVNGNTVPVSLVELSPAGSQIGSPLLFNSTTAGARITINGTSNEGLLKLSGNGQFLTLAGYDQPVATVAATAVAIAGQKVIVTVDNSKTISYATKIIANDVAGNLRSATTNNKTGGFWFGTSQSGVRYIPDGNTSTNATLISTTGTGDTYTNIRSVGIFNDQLYASVVTGTNHGVSAIGSGTPSSTASQSKTALPGVTVNTTMGDFALLDMDGTPGVDVLYVSELVSSVPSIRKYSLVSGTWVLNSTTTPPLTGIYGLAAIKNGTAVAPGSGSGAAVFISTGSNTSDTNLQYVLDVGGYNQPLNGTFTTIASAGTNYVFRGIAFTPNTVTLPVDLTSFTGKNSNIGVQLNWETASERNNERFEILRSSTKDNFKLLTSVKGKGNSDEKNKYSFIDTDPAKGVNYYKLNQIDFDGKVTSFDKLVAVNNGLNNNEFKISNSNDDLNYTINSSKSGEALLTIYDLNGRKVLTKKIFVQTGLNSDKLSITDLNNGVYVANISLEGENFSKKFVK